MANWASGGMAYALVSKTNSRKAMRVRLPPSALNEKHKKINIWITIFGILLIALPVSNIFLASALGYHYSPLQSFFRIIFVLFSVFIGVGIILLKELARKLVVVFSAIVIVISLLSFFINPEIIFKNNLNLIINIWTMVYAGLLLWFFTLSKVKKEFKK